MASAYEHPRKVDPIDLLPPHLSRMVKQYLATHPPDVKPPFVTQGSQPLRKDPRSDRIAIWQHVDGYLIDPRYQYIGRSSWKVIVLHHADRPSEIIASAKAAGQVTTRTKNEDTDTLQTAYYVWEGGDKFEREPSYFKVYLAKDETPKPAQQSQNGSFSRPTRTPARSARFSGPYFSKNDEIPEQDDDEDYVGDHIKKESHSTPDKTRRLDFNGCKIPGNIQASSDHRVGGQRSATIGPPYKKSAYSLPNIYGSRFSTPRAASTRQNSPVMSSNQNLKRKFADFERDMHSRHDHAEQGQMDEGDDASHLSCSTFETTGYTQQPSSSKDRNKAEVGDNAKEKSKIDRKAERVFVDDGDGTTVIVSQADLQPSRPMESDQADDNDEKNQSKTHVMGTAATNPEAVSQVGHIRTGEHIATSTHAERSEHNDPAISNIIFLFKCGISTRAKSFIYCDSVAKLFAHATAVGIFGHEASTGYAVSKPGESDLVRVKIGDLGWRFLVRDDQEEFDEIVRGIKNMKMVTGTGREEVTCIVLVTRA